MEKKITLKAFEVLAHIDGPKRNAADISFKCILICIHQPESEISFSLHFIDNQHITRISSTCSF